MADINSNPSGKKSNTGLLIGIIVVILLGLGAAFYMSQKSQKTSVNEEIATTEETTPVETGPTEEFTTIDVNAALSDRALGSSSAPVKISEHASFTCSHCGDFHRETFKQLKAEYIDTGKVYFVFSDFPLNAPAVHASMVARCLPQDKYFDFVQMLFETQADWAYDSNYLDYLKVKSAEAGLSEGTFQACIENTELQNGIVNRMKGIQQQWNISSTPSFVVNNRTTLSGALPYEDFKKTIDSEIEAQAANAPAPASDLTPAETTPSDEPPPTDEATPAPDMAPVETAPTTAPPAATPGSEESAVPAP